MTQAELMQILGLARPQGKVTMVLDTDTYNEVDDQYALAYALKSPDKLEVAGVYAAPFYAAPFFPPLESGPRSNSPEDGMEKSFDEIHHILGLMGRDDMKDKVYKGSRQFMPAKDFPVDSEAAQDLIKKALAMESGERLYVVAIGAITNVASALLMEPAIKDKIVVVWLGGHAQHWRDNREFNSMQDPFAAQVVFNSGVRLVHAPCMGMTSHLTTTEPELRQHILGKNPLCDYLYEATCQWAQNFGKRKCWSKILWDVITIAWLVGQDSWMESALVPSPIINLEKTASLDKTRHFIHQIQHVYRDYVFEDLFSKLTAD